VIVLDYDWEESFNYLVEEECYISAFFHVAHREMKDLAEALEKTKKEKENEQKFEPDTSRAKELLSKDKEEIETDTLYSRMSYTAQPETDARHVLEAMISAEVKYLWENTAHDLDFYDEENYQKLFSEDLVRHIKKEVQNNFPELI
jgi:hypothetical protein